MKCPKCSANTKVTNTRVANDGAGRRRKRQCEQPECMHRFWTIESIEPESGNGDAVALLPISCTHCQGRLRLIGNGLMDDRISVQRTYMCLGCHLVMYTVEAPGDGTHYLLNLYAPIVTTPDGMRNEYSRKKLAKSLSFLRNRQLDAWQFDEMIAYAEDGLKPHEEITSGKIEIRIMEFLLRNSKMGYLSYCMERGKVNSPSDISKLLDDIKD